MLNKTRLLQKWSLYLREIVVVFKSENAVGFKWLPFELRLYCNC